MIRSCYSLRSTSTNGGLDGYPARSLRMQDFIRGERESRPGDGSEMGFGAQSKHPECGTQTSLPATLVSSWATVEDRMRRSHQRTETTTRYAPLPVSRIPRHAALGRAQCDCRQCDADRALSRLAGNMNRNPGSALLVEPSGTKVDTRSGSHLIVRDRKRLTERIFATESS